MFSVTQGIKGFNPRIRKGCDLRRVVSFNGKDVSIHASVKDATRAFVSGVILIFCFNPRIRKGCDEDRHGRLVQAGSFNPRIRKGCDLSEAQDQLSYEGSFNPRIRKGCDGSPCRRAGLPPGFNPRIRKGCDYSAISSLRSFVCFNPRIRKGCDFHFFLDSVNHYLFQSTHP